MADIVGWHSYEYPRQEVYGEDYFDPCPSIMAEAEIENEKRRKRALKRVMLRSGTHIWEQCCEEVTIERMELDHVLLSMGFPDSRYSKDKSYEERTFSEPPDRTICSARDYLEFYVFPYLIPAIEQLVHFARKNNVLQCRLCTFAPSDFLSEYLYNHNPAHPQRKEKPTPIFETEMAKSFLELNPRPALPKWLKMSKDDAAIAIQRAFRGFLVRRMENVQEMRQFWRDYKKDIEEVQCESPRTEEFKKLLAQFAEEDEMIPVEAKLKAPSKTHSQECDICTAFRKYIQRNKGRRRARSKVNPPARQRDSEKNKFCYQDVVQSNFTALPITLSKKWHPSVSCITKVKCPLERRESEANLDIACAEFLTSTGTIQSLLELPSHKSSAKHVHKTHSEGSKGTDSTQTDGRKSELKSDKGRLKNPERKSRSGKKGK